MIAQQQKFADKSFYLVDSLVLEELSESNLRLIDSCLTLYHKTKEDSAKWKHLNVIIENTYSDDWYKFQKIANLITDDKLKQNLSKKEEETFLSYKAENLNNKGYWEAEKGNLNKATELYIQAVNIQRRIKKDGKLAIHLSNLGNNYYKQGRIQKAIETYEESVILSKKINNKNTSYIISNLAMIYNNLDRIDEAYQLLKEAEEHDKSSEFSLQKAKIYTDLGTISKTKFKDYEKALFYYNKSLTIYKKLQDNRKIADQYYYISDAYLVKQTHDTTKALNYLEQSLNLYIKTNDVSGISSCYERFSRIYLKQNKKDSALIFSEKAYDFALKSNRPQIIQKASLSLSNAFDSLRNYKKAFFFYRKHEKMLDSIKNNENTFALAKTEAKLHYENEKTLENIKHQSELKIKEAEADKQMLYKRFFILGSIFLIIILFVIIRQLTKSNKQKTVIEQSNLKLEEQHNEITSSITYAKRIQNAILPPVDLIKESFQNSFILYKPKDIVSGDFYWLEKTNNKVHFAVADCTGHGVPGAMVSVICNNGLNRSVREYQLEEPNKILDKTREIVIKEFEKSGEDIKDGMDISIITIDKNKKSLEFAGAHNALWIIRKENSNYNLIELKGDKQPIGNFENSFPFTIKKVELLKGDTIYLSSDGYADQFGGDRNKKIKSANFKKLLLEIQDLTLILQKEKLQVFFDDWKGDYEQLDDVCVVGIKI
jgi:serine phosphatase RsbU (regulator of sigma subunit)